MVTFIEFLHYERETVGAGLLGASDVEDALVGEDGFVLVVDLDRRATVSIGL